MGATLYQVSTLLILVGRPNRPSWAGNGGRVRGRPDRGDERGLLAAHEGAGALDELDVEREAAAQDVVAQDAVLARLLDRLLEAQDRERVLCADVHDAPGGTGDVARDEHSLEQRVRVRLDLVAVHVGARVALVRVADQVLLGARRLGQELPFVAGQEPRPAAAAQLGRLDLLDDGARVLVDQDLVQGLVAADRDVLLDVVGVDQAAVAQHDLGLAVEERDLVPQRDVGVAGAVLDVPGEVIPLLHLPQHDVGRRHVAVADRVEDGLGMVGRDLAEDQERPARHPGVDERLLGAEPEAADRGQLDVAAVPVDLGLEGVVDGLGAIARPARAHAHG
jgi:hypothetical protein